MLILTVNFRCIVHRIFDINPRMFSCKRVTKNDGVFQFGNTVILYHIYKSQLLTVRGKGMTSRMLPMPVKYITQRSKPRPKPAWRAEPYFRRSR